MSSDLDQLERLERLRASGALSDAEFQREKERLLQPNAVGFNPDWRFVRWVLAGLAVTLVVVVATLLLMPAPERAVDAAPSSNSGAAVPVSEPSATSSPGPLEATSGPVADTSPVEIPELPTDPKYAKYYNEAKQGAERAYSNFPPAIVAVLGQEAGANDLCRGSTDEAISAKWCPVRDRLVQQLESMGMCYGRPTDQSAAESVWHLCNDGG